MKLSTILIGAGALGALALLASSGKDEDKSGSTLETPREAALNSRIEREKSTTLDGQPLYSGAASLGSVKKGLGRIFGGGGSPGVWGGGNSSRNAPSNSPQSAPNNSPQNGRKVTEAQWQEYLTHEAEESVPALTADYVAHWRKTYQVLEAELPGSSRVFQEATTPSSWAFMLES